MSLSVSVLVVDDQRAFRQVAAAVLRATPGFVLVGEADDGEGAVRSAAALHPALVLMDVHMPGVDGPEATRRIVARAPRTRVVLCSTDPAADLPGLVAQSGAWAYLRKDDLAPDVLVRLWAGLTQRAAGPPG